MNARENEKAIRVLIIEDHADDFQILHRTLSRVTEDFYDIRHAGSLSQGIEQLKTADKDIVILDMGLPDSEGVRSVEELHGNCPNVPIVVMTRWDDRTAAVDALRNGAQDYLVKGQTEPDMLARVIRYAMERHRTQQRLIELNERLEKMVRVDPLTDLLNRRGLQEALDHELRRSRRDGSNAVILLADLDNFKNTNDQLGHAVGDVVLKEVATTLKSALRTTDYIGRIGGDEFMALLPQTRMIEGLRISERLRSAISESPIIISSGKIVKVTASFGVCAVQRDIPSIDEILEKTHEVLAKSKRTGKNKVSYKAEDGVESEDVVSYVMDALSEGKRFKPVMQPIYDLRSERKVGYEILMRSTIKGFEMPVDFFRLSSEHNILTLVDHCCFKTAVSGSLHLPQGARCHLNLFPSTMLDIPAAHLVKLLPPPELTGTRYCIEVSEQQIFGSPAHLLESVKAFKKAGVLIAIDDVGFGRSCLESLVLLKPDIIKIDRKNVHGLAQDVAVREALKRLLAVSRSLDAEIIAEGIEEREDLEVLKQLGVVYGQGFLWGKPATPLAS